MLRNARFQLLTSLRPQFDLRYAEHICPSAVDPKRRCSLRPFSTRLSGAWREVIGIDFGTTNCRVAVMEKDGNPKMIEISDRKICMPSVVSFDQNGKTIVGAHPKDAIPDKTVIGIKRLIGRSYDENAMELQKLKKMIPYEIIPPDSEEEEEEEEAWIKLTNGKKYSPAYIASLIIGRLIDETAKCRGNIYASHAVIAVPPFFDQTRTFALRGAAERHTPCVDVIDESLAASLYYLTRTNRQKGCFAVIDLGGGSFDISIVNASNGLSGPDIKTIATKHVDSVTGVDLDHAIMELLFRRLEQETGEKIHKLGLSAHSSVVRREAERAKIEFFSSSALHSRINLAVRCVQGISEQLEICLERSEFEDSMKEAILKVKDLCWSCLKEANMKPKRVDEIILVGGMSRVPRVWEIVEEIFGKRPSEEVNPDEAVALGAAIKANLIANKNENLVSYSL
ncbi:hypothetical protein KFK09_016101 [Dendrobium nobile]|uniref:Uncharacterized protein n=1 Tax=Dendrobium nobile TaxID=94219 RepID=A0A8T3AYX4_DENNO|nr:hypothetical protein KFK09_016101 [Dendrobium nobile]